MNSEALLKKIAEHDSYRDQLDFYESAITKAQIMLARTRNEIRQMVIDEVGIGATVTAGKFHVTARGIGVSIWDTERLGNVEQHARIAEELWDDA